MGCWGLEFRLFGVVVVVEQPFVGTRVSATAVCSTSLSRHQQPQIKSFQSLKLRDCRLLVTFGRMLASPDPLGRCVARSKRQSQ